METVKRHKAKLDGYTPMTWGSDSKLTAEEQNTVEAQRKELWSNGVRSEPNLTRMAFEFAAVITMIRKAK